VAARQRQETVRHREKEGQAGRPVPVGPAADRAAECPRAEGRRRRVPCGQLRVMARKRYACCRYERTPRGMCATYNQYAHVQTVLVGKIDV